MRKMIVPEIKREKNPFIRVNTGLIISILPCNGLCQLIINGKALRNMKAIP